MTDFVTIETGSNGTIVLVEPETNNGLQRRVFKSVGNCYEWAYLSDWRANGERTRFYGYGPKELPNTMRSF